MSGAEPTGGDRQATISRRRARRRQLLGSGLAVSATAVPFGLAACGAPPGPGAEPARVSGPKEITWSCYQLGEARQKLWDDALQLDAKATGVTINVLWESGTGYWDKRQAETAAGSPSVDVMINQTDWVIPGGLSGMFPDHYEYLRRDKIDLTQFYKAGLDTWSWKGKQWAIPMQVGGEVVLINKALFAARGAKLPTKDWTYDDLLEACRRLNDPANGRFAIEVGQNGIHYMMGTFMYNFGGKLLNDAKNVALYGDDPKALEGAGLDVDLHVKYKLTAPAEARATIPQGKTAMEVSMVAMEINGLFRHTNVRAAIGAENLDFAPPPKGPTGIQRVSVGGNAWSILALSKARDAAWEALKWTYSKDGQQSPLLEGVSWPPIVSAASSPRWLEIFKGTHIADCAKTWETGGHDLLVLPEGTRAWTTMNDPVNRALTGDVGTRDALQESARQLNELFAQRPAAWA
jgi:ABC-type glycerol-3-phosphate transport system substrate-binding protein